MEVIEIPGYSEPDKLQIAKTYLVPRQLAENGLNLSRCRWKDEAIRKVIEDYTREAGVRELERQIGSVCRGVAAQVAKAEAKSRTVNPALVRKLLGPEKYFRESDGRLEVPGVAVGLAYTSVGGEVLHIEATAFPGKGRMTLTGQIGDVMKESATAALSLFKSQAAKLGVPEAAFSEQDLHIHVPAGAVPKDGPSAGIAIYTALASLMSQTAAKPDLAMTGEITLRGLVLPVGGIKEKTLAAARAGIKTILLPQPNQRDEEEIDPMVRQKCRVVYVKQAEDVLREAFGADRLKRWKALAGSAQAAASD
jgi:ATP-dependent Lon protease